MRIFALLALSVVVVSAVPYISQRIVGGSLTDIDSHPSIAAVLYSRDLVTYWQICGGTILNNRSVLTAAHCSYGEPHYRLRVRVGSSYANSGGDVHNISTIIINPSYSSASFGNDMAILRTATNIVYSNVVQPAPIAGDNYNLADNQEVWAVGWGSTSFGGPVSEQLRLVQVWTVNQDVCRQRYGNSVITDDMLCSGYLDVGDRDQCQGDSGGPLYHKNVLVGVSIFGEECGLAYYPGVNARVSCYTSWILANAMDVIIRGG